MAPLKFEGFQKQYLSIFYLLFGLFAFGQKKQNNRIIPPNIILVLVDDLGYMDVGFNGCQDIPTPNIDRIANEGVKFTNGYVSYAVCGPSRAGIITGRYQDRFGFSKNPLFAPKDPNMGLPLTEETLADVLKKAGYNTIAIGKWHLGAHKSLHPLNRGFDDFFGFLSGGHKYFPEQYTLADETEVTSQYGAYNTKLLRNYSRVEESKYLTDALSREALGYIEKYKETSFFMYLAYNAPHAPLQATDKYLKRFDHIKDKKRKTYAAMVSSLDDGVGAILDKLDDLAIDSNTMVIFLSDNGGPESHNASDNGVLRDGKGSLFEGGIRVPFAIRWPSKIPMNTVCDQPVISLDIFATAIAQSNKKITTKNKIDGIDLLPLINENQTHKRNFYWRKFAENQLAIRSGFSKYITSKKDGETLFFDLKTDLSEEYNLNFKFNKRADSLKVVLKEWNESLMDPIFMGLMQNKAYDELNPQRWGKQ